MQPKTITALCESCGVSFQYDRWKSKGRFCSHACYANSIQPRNSIADRLWSKVDKSGECWTWTGFRDPNGYGRIMIREPQGNRPSLAHRVAWELVNGPIPEGMNLCHHCDNPPCVRPDHLFLGTDADNMADASRKGRTTFGERGPAAKLTEQDAKDIRARYAAGGISQQTLAKEYGLAQATVSELIRRLTWTHLP
jgi:hypothetical protein